MTTRLLEQAVGAEITRLLAGRGLGAAEVERRLGLAGGAVQDLAAGHPNLELVTLRRVLTFLDVDPTAFFTRLLADEGGAEADGEGGGDARGSGAAGVASGIRQRPDVARQQVAGLIEQVRRALLEIDPAAGEGDS